MWARTFLSTLLAASVAAADCTEDAMLVFDGSGSMAAASFARVQEPRIASARRAVVRAIPEIAERRDLGLVTYGPGGGDPCDVAADLADRRPSLTIHVIGFQISGAGLAWTAGPTGTGGAPRDIACLVDRTGGQFVDTETAEDLIDAFRETLGCALRF
ncbi:MAG: hypothetical protein AAF366_18150 [Pseudomonadota bacterium]